MTATNDMTTCFLSSHTIPHHYLHWSGAGCEHHQQSVCDHYRGQSHQDREAVARPARREERLWGRFSGELRVAGFRCGGNQKGGGEDSPSHASACRKINPRCLTAFLPLLRCSSATMGPLQRAVGLLTSCLLLCQPKGSNIPSLASAGWPKIEEMG